MNLSFLPSLQNMAAIQIMTRLCNGAEVVALIAECDEYYTPDKQWREIEKRVHEKISLLRLPTPSEEKLSSFVAPMCDEMMRWMRGHALNFKIENIPPEFRWTSRGMLDKKGMAEAFVQDLTLPFRERYGMACLYCLGVNPVPFLGRKSYPLSGFEAFWNYDRTGDATALDRAIGSDSSRTPYRRAFHHAVIWGNEVAAEYYFRKLTPGEREESLSDIELYHDSLINFDLFRFLLLHMDKGQRSKLLEAAGEDVLYYLLWWPWQQFFMDVVRLVRDTLKSDQYYSLLIIIARKIQRGYEDYSYRELFGQFWMEIPVAHKKKVIFKPYLWNELLPFIGEKNILMMLKDLSPEEREELLLSERGIWVCRELARDHQWDALQIFIRECVSSCDQMIHFREKCRKRPKFLSPFFEWIDGLIEKRDGEETDCPVPHKRLCSSPGVSTNHI